MPYEPPPESIIKSIKTCAISAPTLTAIVTFPLVEGAVLMPTFDSRYLRPESSGAWGLVPGPGLTPPPDGYRLTVESRAKIAATGTTVTEDGNVQAPSGAKLALVGVEFADGARVALLVPIPT